ncbi:unnamed protein product [Rotaria sordida]|uniref:Transmembrane protein n=1 Tax=Rotaria sordida TaxID=392033 RepID=A0A815LYU3_9BILA|nr:unnamed protein product [Rotaria sordida]CAF1417264.1 unnamed protein product [Rotaria sordida]
MKFFLFLLYFSYIHCDCLEFINNQSINECFIQQTINYDLNVHHYYSECLQCKIQTIIQPENIKFEENNQCLIIELQCIQLIFNNKEIFEDFFHNYQQFIYDLFNKNNGTDQNTLHIIIKENTIEEINLEYIENIFQLKYQSYRVLFFELHIIKNQNIKINQNLLYIKRLSIKIILICNDEIKSIQTIYMIHNHKITLESQQDLCLPIFIPSTITISPIIITETSSNILLSISHKKSKSIIRIIILLTSCLLCLLILFIICCFKYRRYYRSKLSRKTETTSELSISQDTSVETPLSLNDKPKLKQPISRMRAIQIFEDDI